MSGSILLWEHFSGLPHWACILLGIVTFFPVFWALLFIALAGFNLFGRKKE